jgi:hypothetical protein
MSYKPVLLALAGLVLSAGVFSTALSSIQQQSSKTTVITAQPGTLEWHAQQAKARGRVRVTLPAPIEDYRTVISLDEALSQNQYTVVVAKPIKERSFTRDSRYIETWYKFKIIESLVNSTQSNCYICTLPVDIPQEFLPLKDDEFLALKHGGTLLVDGIEIHTGEADFPQFSKSEKYLMFLELDPVRKVAAIPMGPFGVFNVQADDTLKHINDRQHPFKRDVENNYHGSLGPIKARIKK